MDKRKILKHAGEVFYGVYNEIFETNILNYIIKHPNISKKKLAYTRISTAKNENPKKTSTINSEHIAQKFINIIKEKK